MILFGLRRAFITCFVVCPGLVWSLGCHEPPPSYIRDYNVEFNAAAAKIKGLSGPQAYIKVQGQAQQLLTKIPNADKVIFELTYLYVLCTALRDDKSLTGGQKVDRLERYRQQIRGAVESMSVHPNKKIEYRRPVSVPKKPVEEQVENRPVPSNEASGVTGVVIQGPVKVEGSLEINQGVRN